MRKYAFTMASLLSAVSFCAMAQSYPDKPITMIVPFSAGGPTDTVARLTAEAMSQELGQQVVVQNVGGAGGTLGAGQAAQAAPDGYTILVHHIGMSTAPSLYANLPYDPVESFEPIGLVTNAPMTIIGRKDMAEGTLQELVTAIKADPQAYSRYITSLIPLSSATQERLKTVQRRQARRTYYFSLGARRPGKEPVRFAGMAHAAARPNWIDASNATNLALAVMFAAAVVGMVLYARRNPDLYVRKIAGLDAIDEAIGRATEMGKPMLFVHGLKQVRDIATIASLNILSRLARQVAEYDSELLVTANDPITYSVSHEVVEEGYREAGRPDAFNPDNVFMVASRQFPYVAAVAGIMARHKPAANLFMGSFFAESLILAETGAETGAIQIAGTDSFSQLPFFVTTCDYTLMGEELYAASAYMSREPRLLGTIRAQDMGKSLLLAVIPTGTALSMGGINYLRVLFTAYTKAG